MTEIFIRWGVPILSGFLLGLLAILWIDPQTSGGSVLILVTFVSVSVVTATFGTALRAVIRHYAASRAKKDTSAGETAPLLANPPAGLAVTAAAAPAAAATLAALPPADSAGEAEKTKQNQ